jgi:hypothetical protein
MQVMRWFGRVNDADELWKMNVEKVEHSVGLGYSASVLGLVSASVSFFFPALIPRLTLNLFLASTYRVTRSSS